MSPNPFHIPPPCLTDSQPPCHELDDSNGPFAKVWTSVLRTKAPPARFIALSDLELIEENADSHRGRTLERVMMLENLHRLSTNSSFDFWDLIRDWTDYKQRPMKVLPSQLRLSFQARLKPPETVPLHFDEDARTHYVNYAKSLPSHTTDRTSQQFFSRLFVLGDIVIAKRKLKQRSAKSAHGVDKASYNTILSVPNDALVKLFNMCIATTDMPHGWLTMLLIGILKQGRVPIDPKSYRLISLES
jgi:hypothetical protein